MSEILYNSSVSDFAKRKIIFKSTMLALYAKRVLNFLSSMRRSVCFNPLKENYVSNYYAPDD